MTQLTMNPGITSVAARGLRATPLALALDKLAQRNLRAQDAVHRLLELD